MFHLVKDTVGSIETNLYQVKVARDITISWWINVGLFLCLIFGGILFCYLNYHEPQIQKIPFEAVTWNNAVRNVPTTDYGQSPKIETTNSVQGFANRTSSATF